MKSQSPSFMQNEEIIVDEVIARLGNTINLATPLALGKANHVINAFYRRAKADPSINLNIMTALTLECPKGKSLLEKRFLEPFVERVFGDYPDLDFELDRVKKNLPANIRVFEFYYPPGKFLQNPQAQQDYISSNYTHVARDLMDRGANVIAQLIAPGETKDASTFSLSANPDIALDLINMMQQRGEREGVPFAIVGQVNPNLPYMYGDAEVEASNFHYVLDNPEYYYRIFGAPKLSTPEREHMVGLYLSTLIRDEGELQIGIGAMGDAFINALIFRQKDNQNYLQVLQSLELEEKFGEIINKVGGTGILEKGLFGASEMVMDGFLHLYEAGILKRLVYDDLPIQRLLNEELIGHEVTPATLDLLLQRKAVHMYLSRDDFDYLVKFGVFQDGLLYEDGVIVTSQGLRIRADFTREENKQQILEHCLGDYLKGAAVVHGGFFLGPQDFYQKLKALPEQERRLFNMRSVRRINHLYGHEEIDRLQRKNARFINTCMKVTLSGHVVSDGLEDGRVVSGVGGQYNFVAMAHELPDGRSLINLRSTREKGTKVLSNIVWNYGHTTIPRHLRDIVVTEYGIADLRGKTDSEIIEELLKITDSRFQAKLMQQAKKAGKLRSDYQIPEKFRNNYPEVITQKIAAFRRKGFFPPFPFGTDFTEQEQVVGKALKSLKRKSHSKRLMLRMLIKALFTLTIPEVQKPYLERMGLWQAKGLEERIFRNLLANELKNVVKTE
jgi:acyl-CoA hydrolase